MHLKHLVPLALAIGFGSHVHASIWPVPEKLETGEQVLFIDEALQITYNGEHVRWNPNPISKPWPKPKPCDSPHHHHRLHNHRRYAQDRESNLNVQLPFSYDSGAGVGSDYNSRDVVEGAVSRALTNIFQRNFVPWMLHMRGADFEPSLQSNHTSNATTLKSLLITQIHADENESPFIQPTEDVDESYTLRISEAGSAEIKANSSVGVVWALETFAQLFYQHSSGNAWYTNLAPLSVEDSPKYPHRGILMDTARHFLPVEDVLRTIDGMAMSKMNKLHVHATDSQSWPLEIPAMPEVAAKGAYANGLTYTAEDVQLIHDYAVKRGVQVIVEIDMPGHTGSIALSHPDLILAYNEQPYHWWCVQPPCGQFRLNDSRVDDFLETLFDDFLPRVAPYTAYFHTGGDEINRNDSMLDEGVRSNDTEVLQPLLQRFTDRVHEQVRNHGLVPMVWEEIALEWNITMGEDVIVQAWLGGSSIKEITAKGHKVIDSNSDFWYLDCGRGQWLNIENGAAFEQFYPFNDWCSPTKGWRLIYSHDPADGLTEEEAALVLGGEVTGWSETIDAVNLDTILWPRAAAAGEVLWSGRTDASGENRTQLDAAPRLSEFREKMVARGIGSAPVYMTFCTQHSAEECSHPV